MSGSARYDSLGRATVDVADAAAYLDITPRRLRQLLQQHRIAGYRIKYAWRVFFPIQYTLSRRGPLLSFASKQSKPRPRRTYRFTVASNRGSLILEPHIHENKEK
jgi:hypothetical protein